MGMNLFLLLTLSVGAFAACIPIAGERILGRDLALADARFSALPATEIFGFAPAPGAKRIFAAVELMRIARANSIAIENPNEVCFEIPLHRVSEEEAVEAMRHSLPADADLIVVELSKTDVPAGELDFPKMSLEPSTPADNGIQLWRGFVKYTDTRRMAVWARVSVTQRLNAVVAIRDLLQNVAIDAGALRVEMRRGPIQRGPAAVRVEDVLGRIPKKTIKAGAAIYADLLDQAPAVHRGDAVRVEVRCGATRLFFDAIAEKEAMSGDMIELRNPASGRTFRARLEGAKAVMVVGTADDPAGPLAEKQL